MDKEDLVKLAEAMDGLGYKIEALRWEPGVSPAYISHWVVELSALQQPSDKAAD
jgi:hypothetical protein